MTLDTRIFILDPMPRKTLVEFFVYGQSLLTEYDEDHRTPDQQKSTCERRKRWVKGEQFEDPEASWTMGNKMGQGLPAWWEVYFYPERPYRTAEDIAADHQEYCVPYLDPEDDDPCDGTSGHPSPICHVEASLDTSYGYRDERGWGCSQLHAVLVARLGLWLNERQIRWSWQNEFTSEVFEGLQGLETLTESGEKADAWFQNSVLPMIRAEAAIAAAGTDIVEGAESLLRGTES